MNSDSKLPRLFALLPLLSCLSACNMLTKSSVGGLEDVDGLLGRVERVFVDAELLQERTHESMDALHFMVDPRFDGDALQAHEHLAIAQKRSQKQSEALTASVKRMRKSAETVFEQWAEDLGSFSSSDMRRRSHERLRETRERYRAVLAAVQPALALAGSVNSSLSDHVVFLGHDYNASSVSLLEAEVRNLDGMVVELDENLVATMEACQVYVGERALHGQLEPVPVDQQSGSSSTAGEGR
jgi:ElaB/YqjD/DUF883 family membrane-anchored ribosome-binding protein